MKTPNLKPLVTLSLSCLAIFAHSPVMALANKQNVQIKDKQTSLQGREIPIYRFGEGQAEFIFLFGGFHGNEPQGPYILEQIMKLLEENPAYFQDKSIFVLPRVNPDGIAAARRGNANGVDLNRNFPARNFKANYAKGTPYYAGPRSLSEPESQLVFDLLQPYITQNAADQIKILSIHAPYATNNYNGPAAGLAAAMKQQNGLPVSTDIGYATPGSFGSYYGNDKGIRVITLETANTSPSQAWKTHQTAILALLQFPVTQLYPVLIPPSIKPEPLQIPETNPEISPETHPDPVLSPEPELSPLTQQRWWPLSSLIKPQEQALETTATKQTAVEPTLPAAILFPVVQPSLQPIAPKQPELKALSKQAVLRISKADQKLYVIEQGKVLASFPVSTGLRKQDTPNGQFHVMTRVKNPPYAGSLHKGKRQYAPLETNNPLGTRWMQINAWHYQSGAMLGIHGTDEPNQLGKAVSGGCIRMLNRDIERLFQVIPVGIKVEISA